MNRFLDDNLNYDKERRSMYRTTEEELDPFTKRRMAYDDEITSSEPYERYKKLLGTEAPGLDMLRRHEGERPNEGDYKANFGQKLLASIAGFGAGVKDPARGIQTARGLLREPYERDYERWSGMNDSVSKRATMADAEYNKQLQSSGNDVREERLRQNLERQAVDQEKARRLQEQENARRIANDEQSALRGQETLKDTQKRTGILAQQAEERARHNRELERLIGTGKEQRPPSAYEANREMKAEVEMDRNSGQMALQELKDKYKGIIVPETDDNGKPTGRLTVSGELDSTLERTLEQEIKDIKERVKSGYKSKQRYHQIPDIYIPGEEEAGFE